MKTKRLLTFALAVFAIAPAFAYQYMQQGLSWQRTHYGRVWDYTLSKDTVINGTHYLTGEWLGFYRDDQSGIYEYNPLCNEDILLFPYGAQIGDSLHISNLALMRDCSVPGQGITPGWGDYYGVVTAVDTVTLLNGEQRRRIFYRGGIHDWYIEGIGGPKGWRCETVDWELDDTDVWLCYYIDSTLIWASNDCEQWQSKYPNACLGYTPLKTADTWHAIDYIMVAGKVYSVTDAVYNLTSDTIINEQTYRKLVRNNSTCVGALRQTEDGMKVYFFDLQSGYSHTPQEYLLYDFSASVGDTIDAYFSLDDMPSIIDHMGEPEYIGWLVIEKDTIDGRITMLVARCYDDSISSEISESSLLDYHTRWIQGVGTSHVLWPAYYGVVGMSELFTLCAMHGDETLYTYNLESLGIENNCTEWHFTGLEDIPSDNSRARKFLRDGQLLIETPLGIFNATGRKAE